MFFLLPILRMLTTSTPGPTALDTHPAFGQIDTFAAVHDTIWQVHCVVLLSLEDLVVFAEEQGQNIMEVVLTRVEPNITQFCKS
jgi:hypothetical protein